MSTPLMRELLMKLCRREDLLREEARQAFELIMSGSASEPQIAGLLMGLAVKGTTVEEIVGAASVMREKSLGIECDHENVVVDTCGTGGDVRGTFNISTAAALITAACGVKVAKHGNRSASSKSGSADVLEKLGVRIDLPPERLSRCLQEANICFAFARLHHPAMKHVAPVRAALGVPTVFNVLGPLTNPARARHQLIGVYAPELTERLAGVLREMNSISAWVVHAEDGLDELSTLGPTRISELRERQIHTWTLDPAELSLPPARLEDLQVHTAEESAEAIRGIFAKERGPRRDIAVLNAAGALVVSGEVQNLQQGLNRANDAIDSGAAARTLETLIDISQL